MNSGSGRSFAHAFEKHRKFMQCYLTRRGVKPEDGEDILQEAFLRCYPVLEQDPEGDHRRLLITVIRNLHIDSFRRNRRYAKNLQPEFFDNLQDDFEGRRRRLQCAMIEKILDDISERPESRFFKLHYQEGYKIHEISDMTHTSQGTVSSQIFRFRNRMRASLCRQLDRVDEQLA